MIKNFENKALGALFTKGTSNKLPQERLGKIKLILTALNSATALRDLKNPAFRLHQLKKPPYRGFWSIDVTGNYRIVFRFEDGMICDVDYLDTH
jgi:proteic killer suppression protein